MRKVMCIVLLTLSCLSAWCQKGDFRRGNREFWSGEFDKAEVSYRKGLLKDSSNVAARYNLANTLYREGNMDEAARQMDSVPADSVYNYGFAPAFFYNRGNIAIAQQDWEKAVECYLRCLEITPGDIAAKENYTYARYHIQNNKNNQDQNQDQNQDNQDQDNKDQQQQPQDQDQNQDKQEQQQQPQPQELSPQQAQQLLQAIQEKEKQTQEKVDAQKAQALKSRQKEKNW